MVLMKMKIAREKKVIFRAHPIDDFFYFTEIENENKDNKNNKKKRIETKIDV